MKVYIRPLCLEDAKISYRWRNNPAIWAFTGRKPVSSVSEEVESAWLRDCLQRSDQYRFAICIQESDQYIGNVQIIGVKDRTGEFHIFIGEEQFWGKGLGAQASLLMLKYGFGKLGLHTIRLTVHKDNISARSIYTKLGFEISGSEGDFLKMALTKRVFTSTGISIKEAV